jgi:hypothetical protein
MYTGFTQIPSLLELQRYKADKQSEKAYTKLGGQLGGNEKP